MYILLSLVSPVSKYHILLSTAPMPQILRGGVCVGKSKQDDSTKIIVFSYYLAFNRKISLSFKFLFSTKFPFLFPSSSSIIRFASSCHDDKLFQLIITKRLNKIKCKTKKAYFFSQLCILWFPR